MVDYNKLPFGPTEYGNPVKPKSFGNRVLEMALDRVILEEKKR